jgi:predicted Ser/Thr protein kinase
MAKLKVCLDNQISIFEFLENAQREVVQSENALGGMDIDRVFREMVSEELRLCSLSRYQVAARMSELTGQDITKAMLDSWTAESKEQHRFPAIFLSAFCAVVGSTKLLRMLGKPVGAFVLPGPEALRAEIQRIEEEITIKQNEKRKRMLFLKGMEGTR